MLILALVVATAAGELSPRQLLILQTINASGPAIDRCVTRYLSEQPGQKGLAEIVIQAAQDGRPRTTKVETRLPQARSLRECLGRMARAWQLPPPQRDNAQLKLSIPVYEGAKFRIPKPGEEPKEPEPKEEEPPPPKWFNPASTGFLPSGW